MFENEPQLRQAADRIVQDMIAANIAQKKFYTDDRIQKEYFNLITPDAFESDLTAIAVLGYPEQVGVWSFTLLNQSRTEETSMTPYFTRFADSNMGLVAINPNFFEPDMKGDSFIYQLDRVTADIPADKRIALIGFSMGGRIIVEFLNSRPALIDRTAALVLIDPTLPNRLDLTKIRPILDDNTLLIASKSDQPSPGEIASVLLQIPKTTFEGIHGQMPNKALPNIIQFLNAR